MAESESDASWFSRNSSNASNVQKDAAVSKEPDTTQHLQHRPKIQKHGLLYDMTGVKYLYIFNHKTYKRTRFFKYSVPNERFGTESDVSSLTQVFKNLDFEVETFNDYEYDQIIDVISKLSKQDHTTTSCVCIAILTHGGKGEVYAADRPYNINDLMTLLLHGDSGLVGKPKVMFVQACRGGHTDEGRRVQVDGTESIIMPTHADCLIAYSSYEDHLSYRTVYGTWFIQSLCTVLEEYTDMDILHQLTLVNQLVSEQITNSRDSSIHNKKQISEVKFTLTKKLILRI